MATITDAVRGGHPIQIITATDHHSFELNHEALNALLLNDDVKDKKVYVVSVAGAFRKGKSFLLGFMLRFLMKKGSADDWLGKDDAPLEGFVWKGGSKRETSGIWAWSEVFICPGPEGEEVAVVLMDTQGVYDSKSTLKESVTIFALSTMLSSVLVYNLSQNIQEDDLQHLQFFTEYGRLALVEGRCEDKPFQRLMFLIRDWQYPYEHPYGESGGKSFLYQTLHESADHHELIDLRKDIRRFFKDICCFLMPHPGDEVATNPKFNGQLGGIKDEFKTQLKELAPRLFSEEKILVKEINGKQITCGELLGYIKMYIEINQGDQLPKPMIMFVATTKANNSAAMLRAKSLYDMGMDQSCGRNNHYLKENDFKKLHNDQREIATKYFDSNRMGGESHYMKHQQQLLDDIENRHKQYYKKNANANNIAVAEAAEKIYTKGMNEVLASGRGYLNTKEFAEKDKELRDLSMGYFNQHKMGGTAQTEEPVAKLMRNIDNLFNESYKKNANANNKSVAKDAEEMYTEGMNKATENGDLVLSESSFQEKDKTLKKEAIDYFNKHVIAPATPPILDNQSFLKINKDHLDQLKEEKEKRERNIRIATAVGVLVGGVAGAAVSVPLALTATTLEAAAAIAGLGTGVGGFSGGFGARFFNSN